MLFRCPNCANLLDVGEANRMVMLGKRPTPSAESLPGTVRFGRGGNPGQSDL